MRDRNENETSIGEKPILRLKTGFLVIVGLPLVLGGCGLPIGLQIASLLADGVSFITTEKSLADHGISAIAKKDCAVWRGLKGDDICHNADLDALSVAAIDEPVHDGSLLDSPIFFESEPDEFQAVEIAPLEVASVDVDDVKTPPPPPSSPILKVPDDQADPTATPSVKRQGGTFLIIASYHRANDAQRFAGAQTAFDTMVLAGRVKGRSVFRVAVGPLAKAERAEVRTDLVKAGFADVWVLRQSSPEIIVQLAAID